MAEWKVGDLEKRILRDSQFMSKGIDRVRVIEYPERLVLRLGRTGYTSTRDMVLERKHAERWPGDIISYARSLLTICLLQWKAETAESAREPGEDGEDEA